MKYLLLIITFCILQFSTYAQDNSNELDRIIDSLKNQIQSNSKENEEKVNLLYEYSWQCLRDQQYIEGFEATLKARALSEKIGYLDGEIKYLLTLASFTNTFGLGNYNLHRALLLSKEINSTLNIEYIPGFWQPGDWDNLESKLAPAKDHFNKKKEIEIEAALIGQIVFCYFNTKEFITLERFNDRAVEIHKELKQWYQVLFYHYYKMLNVNNAITNDTEESIEESVQQTLEQINYTDDDPLIPLSLALINTQKKNGSVLAVGYFLEAIEYLKSVNDHHLLTSTYYHLAVQYGDLGMRDKQIEILKERIMLLNRRKAVSALQNAYIDLAQVLLEISKINEALVFKDSVLLVSNQLGSWIEQQSLFFDGKFYFMTGIYDEALKIYERLYQNAIDQENYWNRPSFSYHLAECYYQLGDLSNALEYNLKSYAWLGEATRLNLDDSRVLLMANIYEALGETEKAYNYLKIYQEIVERKKSDENTNHITQVEVRNVLEKSQREIDLLEQEQSRKEQENRIQRLWIFSISGALISAIILTFILFRNNKNKQKANTLLKEQKEEIESTLKKLESTQSQLIQSEKMASLGELTAGIAHEIQNPLNFVNNFSDVSVDLIDEMQEELNLGNPHVAREISEDLKQNLDKIHHHGERASSIVKGMLEHSRSGKKEKELTDLNLLADEYLRLAYHGLRAKDKSFNADFKIELDEKLPKVNVISQDLGRVLLNLINNAFFAVNEKAARHSDPEHSEGVESGAASNKYKPEVIVSTKLSPAGGGKGLPASKAGEDEIEISVRDNGDGIPEQVRDKIFQPFFTTKPTGQGTGLGLSLSYDIITKGHNGRLEMETDEGIGTRFMIILPVA